MINEVASSEALKQSVFGSSPNEKNYAAARFFVRSGVGEVIPAEQVQCAEGRAQARHCRTVGVSTDSVWGHKKGPESRSSLGQIWGVGVRHALFPGGLH